MNKVKYSRLKLALRNQVFNILITDKLSISLVPGAVMHFVHVVINSFQEIGEESIVVLLYK